MSKAIRSLLVLALVCGVSSAVVAQSGAGAKDDVDLAPTTGPSWPLPLVPRMQNNATGTDCPLPETLVGNFAPTYWNVHGNNLGDADTQADFFVGVNVDGVSRGSAAWGPIGPGHGYIATNQGALTIKGGRHSLTCVHDKYDDIAESNEDNNTYGRQFIWTPVLVLNEEMVTRTADIDATGGWDELDGGVFYKNCDGLNMPTTSRFWHAMAVWSDDPDHDVDCRLHTASTGIDNGFGANVASSGLPGEMLDIVVANRNVISDASWDVGIICGDGFATNYHAFHASAPVISFGDSLTYTMDAGVPVLMKEFLIGDDELGLVSFTAQASDDDELNLLVLDMNFTTGTVLSHGVLDWCIVDDGELARVTAEVTESGWYCVMVHGSPADGFPQREITIETGVAPTDLTYWTPEGWYSPMVPRPEVTAWPDCPILPEYLFPAPGNTFINLAAKNAGQVASSLPSRIYHDGVDLSSIDWPLIEPGVVPEYRWQQEFHWPAGRHTLSYRIDPDNIVEEIDESNNRYGDQWVWNPVRRAMRSVEIHAAPPEIHAGLDDFEASQGGAYYSNCDGLRLNGLAGLGYWRAMAIRPTEGSDYDLRVYEPMSGTKEGFKTALLGSGELGNAVDYILVDYNVTEYQDYDVGVQLWYGEGDYTSHMTGSSYEGNAGGTLENCFMDEGELLHMTEFNVTPGDWRVRVVNSSGVDLGLRLHRSGQPLQNPVLAVAEADEGDAGADESLVLTVEETGYYCVVVHRADLSTEPVSFDLIFSDAMVAVDDESVPQATRLACAYPNPFNPQTRIDFDLASTGNATVVIYDVQGRKVKTLVNETLPAGRHSAVWKGRDDSGHQVGSGVYFARLEARSGSSLTKLLLVK